MNPANPLGTPSLVLSGLVLTAAGFLAVRQWLDTRDREGDGEEADSEADDRYHARQDVRRRRGIILMGLIGLTASTGYWINPAAGRDQARMVVVAWVIIGFLLLVLVALAGLDWLHLVAYARRHRRQLAEERQALLEAHRRQVLRRAPPARTDDEHPA